MYGCASFEINCVATALLPSRVSPTLALEPQHDRASGRDANPAVAVEQRVRSPSPRSTCSTGGSSARTLSAPATTTRFSTPTRRRTRGESCWLPRPSRKPWPPITPSDERRGDAVAEQREDAVLVEIRADERAVAHGVDAERRRLEAERAQDPPVVVPGPSR